MKSSIHQSLLADILRNSGIVAAERPSVHSPIAVKMFFRNNADGTIRSIWLEGVRKFDGAVNIPVGNLKSKWVNKVQDLFFALGFGGALSHGRLVLYTDVPTATYLRSQWRMPY